MPKDDEQIFWGWAADTNRKEYEYWRGLYVRYRLDSEGFERFWQEQNGRCVCGREFAHPTRRRVQKGYQPQVDHKHRKGPDGKVLQCETADVRGLLCQRCNRLLGVFRDNIDVVAGLLKHLQRHGDLQL